MTANFWRWEVDPFFTAAEDVQDSTDRLESAYRTWVHTTGLLEAVPDDPEALTAIDFRRRELTTALGTAKWQLDEFERAVTQAALVDQLHAGEDAPARHRQFVEAIRSKVGVIEKVLLDAADSLEIKSLPVVNLDDEDKDDLASFLSGTRSVESRAAREMQTIVIGRGRSKGENPSTSSGSRESRGCISSTRILPASGMARIITEIRNTSTGASPESLAFETKNVDCHILDPSAKNANRLVDIWIEKGDNPVSKYLPDSRLEERVVTDDDRCREIALERTNGQHKVITVNSGLNCWKVEALARNVKDKTAEPRRSDSANNGLTLWALFSKKKRPTDKGCKNGFKRWKDGDADSKDLRRMSSYSNFDGALNALELGTSDSWLGDKNLPNGLGSTLVGEEQFPRFGGAVRHWGLQRTQHSFPVQLASAILVALGFVGLLSFHVTAAL